MINKLKISKAISFDKDIELSIYKSSGEKKKQNDYENEDQTSYKCPFCSLGELQLVVKKNTSYFETNTKDHEITCQYASGQLQNRQADFLYDKYKIENIEHCRKIINKIGKRLITGDLKLLKDRRVLPIKNIDLEFVEDDFSVRTIFYGTVKVNKIDESATVGKSNAIYYHVSSFSNDFIITIPKILVDRKFNDCINKFCKNVKIGDTVKISAISSLTQSRGDYNTIMPIETPEVFFSSKCR